MADLKTELMKLNELKFDDDVESTEQVSIVLTSEKPVVEKIWDYVKVHPWATAREVIDNLDVIDPNIDERTVGTRLVQLHNAGRLKRDSRNGTHTYAVYGDTYKRYGKIKGRPKKVGKTTKLKAVNLKTSAAAQLEFSTKLDIDELLSTLSVVEARALLNKLKELFEG